MKRDCTNDELSRLKLTRCHSLAQFSSHMVKTYPTLRHYAYSARHHVVVLRPCVQPIAWLSYLCEVLITIRIVILRLRCLTLADMTKLTGNIFDPDTDIPDLSSKVRRVISSY